MATPDSPLDYIDYTAIRFPSDQITIRDIRRAHPDRFDVEGGERFKRSEAATHFHLNEILYAERLLARAAYESALGKGDGVLTERGLTRADFVADLAEFYRAYGVATGPHQTEQLVRGIETQAAAQAVGHSPS